MEEGLACGLRWWRILYVSVAAAAAVVAAVVGCSLLLAWLAGWLVGWLVGWPPICWTGCCSRKKVK